MSFFPSFASTPNRNSISTSRAHFLLLYHFAVPLRVEPRAHTHTPTRNLARPSPLFSPPISLSSDFLLPRAATTAVHRPPLLARPSLSLPTLAYAMDTLLEMSGSSPLRVTSSAGGASARRTVSGFSLFLIKGEGEGSFGKLVLARAFACQPTRSCGRRPLGGILATSRRKGGRRKGPSEEVPLSSCLLARCVSAYTCLHPICLPGGSLELPRRSGLGGYDLAYLSLSRVSSW